MSKYQRFFDFILEEHSLILTKGEIDDIVNEVEIFNEQLKIK